MTVFKQQQADDAHNCRWAQIIFCAFMCAQNVPIKVQNATPLLIDDDVHVVKPYWPPVKGDETHQKLEIYADKNPQTFTVTLSLSHWLKLLPLDSGGTKVCVWVVSIYKHFFSAAQFQEALPCIDILYIFGYFRPVWRLLNDCSSWKPDKTRWPRWLQYIQMAKENNHNYGLTNNVWKLNKTIFTAVFPQHY